MSRSWGSKLAGTMKSLVEAEGLSNRTLKGLELWTDLAPAVKANPEIMFAKVVVEGGTVDRYKVRQIEPPDSSREEFEIPQKNAFHSNINIDPMSFGDIGMITYKNAPCVLSFLKHRYVNSQIYTTADPLLVAINPYKDLGNTTDAVIKQYHDIEDVSKMPPHVFTTARVALDNLHQVNKSQTIIVSGESGAGKTEATKQIMRYFAAAKSGTTDTRIQTAVLAANPVLEAFGNAKTVRNNNSSRFGRFMQLQVGANGGIEFGSVQSFLLEKSRIVRQTNAERSYHIFYHMLKGATAAQKSKWKLKQLSDYELLNPISVNVEGIDDLAEWKQIENSFISMQRTKEEIDSIFSIVSGVLALGNVKITGGEQAKIDPRSEATLQEACELLFLNTEKVKEGLLAKISKAGHSTVRGYWSSEEADVLKLSLAKAMYERLFNWIITRLNESIEPPEGFTRFIGMLDIFGFEIFPDNSLEQLFINTANEMLQKTFIDVVFDRETKLYRSEGISSADLTWTSNAGLIDLLCGRKLSLMTFLEDQCLAPAPSDEKFLNSSYRFLGNGLLKPSKVQPNRNFVIAHTIGVIQYQSEHFVDKNKDILRAELVDVVQASANPVCAGLFDGVVVERGKLAKGSLISNQFTRQLQQLMELINSTEPHFIRCIRPNEHKQPLTFVNDRIYPQLIALSILEALELRNLGYSYRRPFKEFLYQFRFIDYGTSQSKTLNVMDATVKLLEKAEIPRTEWQLGKTMIFIKSEAVKVLTRKQRESMAAWNPLVTVTEAMLRKKLLQEEIAQYLPSLIRFQAQARRYLAVSD